MPRPSFDNEVSHSPQVDNEKLYTDFKREFLDSLKQIDRRGFIEHEKKFLYSLEVLANNIGKTKKPVYEDIVQIYHKINDSLHREKFSPVIDTLKEILQKYVPFSEVPREKTVESKEKILSDWKFEIRNLTRTAVDESSKMFPSSFSAENRWVKQIEKEIDLLFQSITLQNFEQKKITFQDWITNKIFSLPEQSQAYKLLQKIKSFLDTGEKTPEPANIFHFNKPLESGQSTFQREILPQSLEIRRKFLKLLDHVEVIRSKQLTSPPEQRVHMYLRTQIDALTEDSWKEKLLMLQKFLLPLAANTNSENFKQLRTEFLETIETLLPSKVTEKQIEEIAPEPPVSEPELPQAQIEVAPPTNLPLEEASVPPTEDSVLRTVDGEITFDPAAVQAEFESEHPDEAGEIALEPFEPVGGLPDWESHHVTPGTQILKPNLPQQPSSPVSRPTVPFQIHDLEKLRAQMQGLTSPTQTQETSPLPPQTTHEESMDFDLGDIDFGSLSPRENVHQRFIEAGLATFTGTLDENRQYHDGKGKLVITKGMKNEQGQKLPDYEYTVEGNFEHGKIVGEAHITYAAETGGPLEIVGPVDDDFKPHGLCRGVNLNKSIEFVGEFIHGTPFEGKFYQFLSETNSSEKTPLLEGVHYATINLEPVNEFGDYFFTPNGKRLLDDDGKRLPGAFDPRTEDSGPHSLAERKIDDLPPLEENLDEDDETPFGGEEFTMFGGQSLADFENKSVDELLERPVDTSSGEQESVIPLPDGSMALYRGKFDADGKPHDGAALLLIDGRLPRSVKIPYENGIALREEAAVHFSVSDRAEATLVGPVDINFLPDGKVKGQIHVENAIYSFEGELSHGIPEVGFIHCSAPEISYFGPVTQEFLPDDEQVLSKLGIISMTDAEQTMELPASPILETNPLPKLDLNISERFQHTIEKALLSLPLNTDFASAEQSILTSFQSICIQYKDQKNLFIQSLGEYLPEVHTYVNSLRLNDHGEENFSEEFRTSLDTIQKLYDKLLTEKTGEFNFGENLHLTEKYKRDQEKNKKIQFEKAKEILKNEFHKKYPEIDVATFYREISTIEEFIFETVSEEEKENITLGLLSILTHSTSREDLIVGIATLLENKVEKNQIEIFEKLVADSLYGEQIPEASLSQTKVEPQAPEITLQREESTEVDSSSIEKLPELDRNVRILRTKIRDLISDTLDTGLLSKKEHDAIIKDFSMSLRRNDFKDLTDFLSTLSKGQAKLDQMKENATPTFRAFCGNLDAIVLSALQTNKPSETPFPDSSEIDTDTSEIHIPPESNEGDDDEEGDLVDPTDNSFEEAHIAIQTPQGAATVETNKPLKKSNPILPSIITEEPSFESLSPKIYQEKLKKNVQKLVETGKLSESLSHAITEEFYTLFDLNSPFTAQAISEKIALLRTKVLQRLSSTTDFQQIRAAFETPEPLVIWPWQREEKQKKSLRNNPDAKMVYALWKLTISVNELAK